MPKPAKIPKRLPDLLKAPRPQSLPKPLRVPYNPEADRMNERKRRLRRQGP